MQSLSKPLRAPLMLLIAALLLVTARPAAAAQLDAPWSGSGTATTKVASDGATADPQFQYDSRGFSGAWAFSAVAGSSRSVQVKYDYSGLHAWYEVTVGLERFVRRNGVDVVKDTLVKQGPAVCCTSPSNGFAYTGTTTFAVQKGDVYGFRMTGGNFDSNDILQGTLKLHALDDTPPVVTPVVTGKAAANGYYGAGPVSVKWTVQDAESAISAKTGCDDATVSEDTAGKTFTCSATSGAGTTTKSVTIKRDATAPELTVPATVIQQAPTAAGATLTYKASATDAIDPAPQLACSRASGTTLPVGTTTVTCTAKDAAGNVATKSFDAIVLPAAAPQPAPQPGQPSPQPGPQPAPQPGLKRIDAVLAFRFVISHKTTRLLSLKVRHIPLSATVTVTCKGATCPKPLRGRGLAMQSKGSAVSLTALVRSRFKSGTQIRVTISSPGAVTAVKTLVVRKGKAPVVGNSCRVPGAKKPVAC